MCLQKRIEDEEHSSFTASKGSDAAGAMSNEEMLSKALNTLLHQIQLAANILKRPIVLIGDDLSRKSLRCQILFLV